MMVKRVLIGLSVISATSFRSRLIPHGEASRPMLRFFLELVKRNQRRFAGRILLACKVESPGKSEMPGPLAHEPDTSAFRHPPQCRIPLTCLYGTTIAVFSRCDGLFLWPSALTERPVCQLGPDRVCGKVTGDTDRDSHQEIFNEVHGASPLSVRDKPAG